MVVKRKRVNRTVDLIEANGNVIDLPPGWIFTIKDPDHGEITFNFTQHRCNGREILARHFRDAIWSLWRCKDANGTSLKAYFNFGVTRLWGFLDDLNAAGRKITRLDEIDKPLIDMFIAWTGQQIVSRGPTKGKQLSLSSRKTSYNALKALLRNRERMVRDQISPQLGFPKNPFPQANHKIPHRKEYSRSEHQRIVMACNADLKLLHEQGGEDLSQNSVLALHLVIFALSTGRNMTPLIELRRDSLRPHPLEDRELLITYKRRGYNTQATALRSENSNYELDRFNVIPTTVGEHFRFLCDYTSKLMNEVSAKEKDYVFLKRLSNRCQSVRSGQVVRLMGGAANKIVCNFGKRHGLLDDQGQPLILNLSRCRPTFATQLYIRTGDARKVQYALGHASITTTVRHYIGIDQDTIRNHSFAGQAMVDWTTSQDDQKALKLCVDSRLPLAAAKELLKGGYNTVIARCRNPFRENGDTCGKYMACFKCPSMIVFEDDLWRLFSFYYRLLSERNMLPPNHWMKTYGPIIRIVDEQIAPHFNEQVVSEAKQKARNNPHPAWRKGLAM